MTFSRDLIGRRELPGRQRCGYFDSFLAIERMYPWYRRSNFFRSAPKASPKSVSRCSALRRERITGQKLVRRALKQGFDIGGLSAAVLHQLYRPRVP